MRDEINFNKMDILNVSVEKLMRSEVTLCITKYLLYGDSDAAFCYLPTPIKFKEMEEEDIQSYFCSVLVWKAIFIKNDLKM